MEPFSTIPKEVKSDVNDRWVASRFNILSHEENGDLYICNTYTGAFLRVPQAHANKIKNILRSGCDELDDTAKILANYGFLIKSNVDEFKRARILHEIKGRNPENMYLIFLVTEQCNFRCTYCYENFEKGKMSDDVIEGVIKYVEKRGPQLKNLNVHWFGGEPLLALDVIEKLSNQFLLLSEKYNFKFRAGITTNGFLLNSDTATKLLKLGVDNFQITIDGPEHIHDQTRKLVGGQGTFKRIFNNLKNLSYLEYDFQVRIRVNFDKSNEPYIRDLSKELSETFSNDGRFHVNYFPIGRWGGPNDEDLDIFDTKIRAKVALSLCEDALNQGLSTTLGSILQPGGYVCYAADPNSYVIGSDGTLYKCTVALYNEKNKIGKVEKDGNFRIDIDKFALWVMNDESEDEGCKKCFLRPSCQGSACPLIRIETGKAPCPPEKQYIKQVVRVVGRQKKFISERKIKVTKSYS
ncbi:hypothetical protein GT3570_15910 [Geobacillus thermoleovorans]|uniref:radical SAM/SPASM domain-containing protein n=1 Tax=Geobacillus thermoleovorans TaxID=33941 RepID=UPI00078EA302|nr:hypothetical protein GT3570_15910 [Geobacillus thermoleovorans]